MWIYRPGRSPDNAVIRRPFGWLHSSFSRRFQLSSAVRCSLLLVQSTTPAFVGCSAFFVPRSASSLSFFDYFQSALPGLDICTFQTTVRTWCICFFHGNSPLFCLWRKGGFFARILDYLKSSPDHYRIQFTPDQDKLWPPSLPLPALSPPAHDWSD